MARTSPQSTQDLHASRKELRDLRNRLATNLAGIKSGCPMRIEAVLQRIGNRYAETTEKLHHPRPATDLYADEKFEKRVRNYAKAQCNIDARGERIEAEPVKRGAKAAVEHWKPESKKDQAKAAEDRKEKAEKRKKDAEAKKAAGGGKKRGGKAGGGKSPPTQPSSSPAPASHRAVSRRGGVPHDEIRAALKKAGGGADELVIVWDALHPQIIQYAQAHGITDYVKALQEWAKVEANMEMMMDALDAHQAA